MPSPFAILPGAEISAESGLVTFCGPATELTPRIADELLAQ